MGNKLKVTVTIDEAIVREIDRASKEHGESRSRVIETAIQQWRERELKKQLIDGFWDKSYSLCFVLLFQFRVWLVCRLSEINLGKVKLSEKK